jgi:periplasmic copper chaperone A
MKHHAAIPLILAASSFAAAAGESLRFENLWIREAPPVAKVLAAYGRICNDHTQAITIVALTGPAFARVEMHETIETDSSVSMRRLKEITLEANKCVDFEPGGRHFMLFGPTQPMRAGADTELAFELSSGIVQEVTATVRRQQDNNKHYHQHEHDHEH